jgi:hypothetical protein
MVVCIHTHTHIHTHIHTHTHTRTHTHTHTHTCIYMNTHTHTYVCIYTCICIYNTRAHARTHTHTHTQTRTFTHTHTHTHNTHTTHTHRKERTDTRAHCFAGFAGFAGFVGFAGNHIWRINYFTMRVVYYTTTLLHALSRYWFPANPANPWGSFLHMFFSTQLLYSMHRQVQEPYGFAGYLYLGASVVAAQFVIQVFGTQFLRNSQVLYFFCFFVL